jgi:hypothetical protein
MIQRKRSRLSPTEKNDIWSRWKSGQSLHEIKAVPSISYPRVLLQRRRFIHFILEESLYRIPRIGFVYC